MAGSIPNGSLPGSASSVTAGAAVPAPFPPPRTRFPSFRGGVYPRSDGEDKSNLEDMNHARASVAVPSTQRSPSSPSSQTSSSMERLALSFCVTAAQRRIVRSGSTSPRKVVPSRRSVAGPAHASRKLARRPMLMLPGVIIPGNMSMGLLASFLEAWAGPATLRRLGTTFRGLVLPDRTIRLCAAVTQKESASRSIELDVWLEGDEGERWVLG